MIQVSFYSVDTTDDVCHILENDLTNSINIEEWLMKKSPQSDLTAWIFHMIWNPSMIVILRAMRKRQTHIEYVIY